MYWQIVKYLEANGKSFDLDDFSLRDDGNGVYIETWNDQQLGPKPSDAVLAAYFNDTPYSEKRSAEYPPIGDQLDDLFKQGAFSAEMAAKLQAVKDKYPKE